MLEFVFPFEETIQPLIILDFRVLFILLLGAFISGTLLTSLRQIRRVKISWESLKYTLRTNWRSRVTEKTSFDPLKWYQFYLYTVLLIVSLTIISTIQGIIIAEYTKIPFNTWFYLMALYGFCIILTIFIVRVSKFLTLILTKITSILFNKIWFFRRFRDWLGDF